MERRSSATATALLFFQFVCNYRRGNAAALCAFDVIEINGQDLRRQPIEDRKLLLKELLRKAHPGITYNRHFDVEGGIVFHHACKLGCEVIVSKGLGSPYTSGRVNDWLKIKNPLEVAQIGAAIGREFSYALLSAVARKPETELKAAFDRLVAAGLLFRQGVPPHASYLFKHALVQDAAYGSLLREPRRTLHARIAVAIERQFAEIAGGRSCWPATAPRPD
jgi:hypothetical protein